MFIHQQRLILALLHMRHGILEQDKVQSRIDFIVAVKSFQQGLVQAPPGLNRHVFGFTDARGEMTVHIHGPGHLQGLLHILVGIKSIFKTA